MNGDSAPYAMDIVDAKAEVAVAKAIPDDLEANSSPVQYHCDYCKRDLSNNIRIHFDLCLHCFVIGVELRDHLNSHDYRIIDNMHFPFLDRNWSADEEQLMLEGLEKYGLGNWLDVAEEISTKDKHEAKAHYEKYYFGSPQWPLPDYSNPLADRERVRMLNSGLYNKTIMPDGVIVKKELVNKKDKAEAKPTPPMDPKFARMTGYMPMREEFETELYPGAERMVMDVSFSDEDTPEERSMKERLVRAYDWKLRDRANARKFVVARRLHDSKYQDKIAKQRIQEARMLDPTAPEKMDAEIDSLHKELQKFQQVFPDPADNEKFLLGRLKECQLLKEIAQLQNYRKRGITTFTEANEYDRDKARRDEIRTRDPASYSRRLKREQARPLDLTGQDGVDLLTRQEKQLCEVFHIRPQQYFVAKEALLREYVQTGSAVLSKEKARQVADMEASKIEKIFTFLLHVGWINSPSHSNHRGSPSPLAVSNGGLKRKAMAPPTGGPKLKRSRKK